MTGKWLTPEEMAWVFEHSERLSAQGYAPTAAACLADYAFASVDTAWQALILADMRFQLGAQ